MNGIKPLGGLGTLVFERDRPEEGKGALAFAQLYRSHQRLVRSVIFQIAGDGALDDLVQEAFVKIWKGLPRFNGESKLSSWIYRVSANVALDHCRSRAHRSDSVSLESTPEEATPCPEEGHARRELLVQGLGRLSPDHRAVLVLAFLHDLSLGEISETLAVPEGTVKSRLHHAKNQIRDFLDSKGVHS